MVDTYHAFRWFREVHVPLANVPFQEPRGEAHDAPTRRQRLKRERDFMVNERLAESDTRGSAGETNKVYRTNGYGFK